MVDLLNYSKNQLCQHNIQNPGKVSRIRSWMARLCRKMRCSKVKLISTSLMIFSIVAGVHFLLSHSEVNDRRGSHLTRLSSGKWRSSEPKPHAQGETWISGKLLQSSKYLLIFNFSRPFLTDSFCFCSANEVL